MKMTKPQAAAEVQRLEDQFWDEHPKRKRASIGTITAFIQERLCEEHVYAITAALEARCPDGDTDPYGCSAVFIDAVERGLDYVP